MSLPKPVKCTLSAFLLLIAVASARLEGEERSAVLDEKLALLVRQGIKDNYELDYDHAVKIFRQLIRDYPKNPAGYTYLSLTLWVKELNARRELSIDRLASPDFFSESRRYKMIIDSQKEKEFREITNTAIETAKAVLHEHPDDPSALFMLGIAYANLASFEATLKRSWWQAFRNGSKAEKYHRRLLKHDPAIIDVYQTIGVSDYTVGSLPLKVRWLASAFGHHGDKERGKQELLSVVAKGDLFKDDSRLLLALIYTRERNLPEAYKQIEQLHKKYPKNYLLAMDLGGLAVLMKNYDLAEQIYRAVMDKVDRHVPNYNLLNIGSVYNRLGNVYLLKREYQKAQDYFTKTIAHEKSDADIASLAHLELGKTLDLMGNRTEALKEYAIVLQRGDVVGTHDDARKYSKSPFTASP